MKLSYMLLRRVYSAVRSLSATPTSNVLWFVGIWHVSLWIIFWLDDNSVVICGKASHVDSTSSLFSFRNNCCNSNLLRRWDIIHNRDRARRCETRLMQAAEPWEALCGLVMLSTKTTDSVAIVASSASGMLNAGQKYHSRQSLFFIGWIYWCWRGLYRRSFNCSSSSSYSGSSSRSVRGTYFASFSDDSCCSICRSLCWIPWCSSRHARR